MYAIVSVLYLCYLGTQEVLLGCENFEIGVSTVIHQFTGSKVRLVQGAYTVGNVNGFLFCLLAIVQVSVHLVAGIEQSLHVL